jgi:hypothetical protein
MGASEWSRKVPYQADLAAALHQAREEAYRDGAFYRDEQDPRALPGDDLDRWFGTRRPNAALVERALGEGLSGVNWPESGRRSVAQTSASFLSHWPSDVAATGYRRCCSRWFTWSRSKASGVN